jgi:hypothetical protein
MPREGASTFRDLVGKLDVLNVECEKCGRRSLYHLDRLIARCGIDAKLFDWTDEITADCPRKIANKLDDLCGARCPDLPKVLELRVGRSSNCQMMTPHSGTMDGLPFDQGTYVMTDKNAL